MIIPFPDRHQDHKIVFDLGMTVTRPKGVAKDIKIVACMEIPSATYYSAPSIEPIFIQIGILTYQKLSNKKLMH